MSMLSEIKAKKRSVAQITKLAEPLDILKLCKKAYDYANQPTNYDFKLCYASFIATLYLTGLRVSECLSLYKNMFRRYTSMEKREFIVIENVPIGKSKGRMRNIAIYPKDPLAEIIQAYLNTIEPYEKLYPFTRQGAHKLVVKISEGQAWNHWFRAQRDSFLAWRWGKFERKKIMGWSSGQRQFFRDSEDRYAFLGWLWYADDLAKITEIYWSNNKIPSDILEWMKSLGINPSLGI